MPYYYWFMPYFCSKIFIIKYKMLVIIFLFFCSVLVAGIFLFAFIWNVKNGQYDDEFSSANRILYDDKK